MPPVPALAIRLSPRGRRAVTAVLWAGAAVGLLLGVETVALHLSTDPLADARVYYDAGARLNVGLPLYDTSASDSVGLYLNPPLLAILWRPLALLPFPAAAVIWMAAMLGALGLTLWRIGIRQESILVACWLALPIGWALSVGQAEPIVTMLMAFGSPAGIALAGNIKLVPLLAAVHWAARRDLRLLVRLALWTGVIVGVQVVVEPRGSSAFLQLSWLHPAFAVLNVSPYVVSPLLWAAMAVTLAVVAWPLVRTRFGWAAALVLAVVTYPRLLVYLLSSLLAALGGPRDTERAEAAP